MFLWITRKCSKHVEHMCKSSMTPQYMAGSYVMGEGWEKIMTDKTLAH